VGRAARLPLLGQSLLTLAIVTPLGPLIYRLAYESSPTRPCWCC
jgi:hypothetical protein